MLQRKFRITSGKEYNTIYKYGKKLVGRYLVIFIKNNDFGYNRFGIVTSKKIGIAVKRNRIKRQLRSIVKTNDNKKGTSCDFVIIARYNIKDADYILIERDFIQIMKRTV